MTTSALNGAPQYTVRLGDQIKTVPAEFSKAAAQVAGDSADSFISDDKFVEFFQNREGVSRMDGGEDAQVLQDKANELKASMTKMPNPAVKAYHNFGQLIDECDKVKDAHPGFVTKTSVGKTDEGRDLWLYTITQGADNAEATAAKPGFVLMKNIHAREWATGESSPAVMHALLDNVDSDTAKQNRLKDGVVYLLACQNPDGREYSFTKDNMWRKNRHVITDANGKPTGVIGVDPNRNFGEPNPVLNHSLIWDPLGHDGKKGPALGQTSDDPNSDCYRGASAGSEAEVAAAQKVISMPNVVGVNDCHSYSADILPPWDHTKASAPDPDVYKAVTDAMTKATGYRVEAGIDLYPNSGDTCIYGAANGKITMTTEIGKSFQPSASVLPGVVKEAVGADLAMIDSLLVKAKDGTLGPRTPIVMPGADQNRMTPPPEAFSNDPIARYFLD